MNAPLELHMYPGQDGHFTMYDDESDNYSYEQGKFANISLDWDDQNRKLTIDARQGSYPGMPTSREFRPILVGENVAPSSNPIVYSGQETIVDLAQ